MGTGWKQLGAKQLKQLNKKQGTIKTKMLPSNSKEALQKVNIEEQ